MSGERLDHGVLNLPLSKRGGGDLDAQIDRHLASERRRLAQERRRLAQERRAARIAREAAQPKFTAADLVGAVLVRDRFGWHRVVRVNAKSVTVATGHSWDDRIALDRVLEFRLDSAATARAIADNAAAETLAAIERGES